MQLKKYWFCNTIPKYFISETSDLKMIYFTATVVIKDIDKVTFTFYYQMKPAFHIIRKPVTKSVFWIVFYSTRHEK